MKEALLCRGGKGHRDLGEGQPKRGAAPHAASRRRGTPASEPEVPEPVLSPEACRGVPEPQPPPQGAESPPGKAARLSHGGGEGGRGRRRPGDPRAGLSHAAPRPHWPQPPSLGIGSGNRRVHGLWDWRRSRKQGGSCAAPRCAGSLVSMATGGSRLQWGVGRASSPLRGCPLAGWGSPVRSAEAAGFRVGPEGVNGSPFPLLVSPFAAASPRAQPPRSPPRAHTHARTHTRTHAAAAANPPPAPRSHARPRRLHARGALSRVSRHARRMHPRSGRRGEGCEPPCARTSPQLW